MLDSHPKALASIDRIKLADCIRACYECAQTCSACADTCLNEDMAAELTTCIRTNLDCVDICAAAGKILSRHAGDAAEAARAMLEACRTACVACADECGRRASIRRHCELCAEACSRAELACAELLSSLAEYGEWSK
ncbi:four-helix bundle copper-binding protein [Pseudarthrobacter phenanthrenivorans]|uniref:Four-helix bundle copper-binding protein n=2 Tax=Pseudarthrobacter phenanthrenivorans TaxID=361575 RepID=A0A3B0FP10_PSEPS|nr:four-helix bundle copper-binding protein [Pseudarthrobacter phenanthrenivorans]